MLLILSLALFAIAYAWQKRSTDALMYMESPLLYNDINAAAAASYFGAVLAAMLWVFLTVYENAMSIAL
jgi:hypothetical protein